MPGPNEEMSDLEREIFGTDAFTEEELDSIPEATRSPIEIPEEAPEPEVPEAYPGPHIPEDHEPLAFEVEPAPELPVFGLQLALQQGYMSVFGELMASIEARAKNPLVPWRAIIEMPVYAGSMKIVMDLEEVLRRRAAFVYSQTGVQGNVVCKPAGIGYIGDPESEEHIMIDRFEVGIDYPQGMMGDA